MKQIQKGFTLIELMIVVAIIGILAAVAIPAYQDYVTKAKLASVQSTMDPLKLALVMYFQEQGAFPSVATTTVTAATQNGVITDPIWTSLGLTANPTLSKELKQLDLDSNGKLTITFADNGVGTGIDGKTLIWNGTSGGTGVVWKCDTASTLTTTAAGKIARKFFDCP